MQGLEDDLGKPAIVSNQAMMWDCLRSAGIPDRIDGFGRLIGVSRSKELSASRLQRGLAPVLQPGSFYRSRAVADVGGPSASFYLLMDVELWIRLLSVGPAHRIDACLAQFRVHEEAKSSEKPWWDMGRNHGRCQ